MSKPLDFQSIILSLQHFWADQGCLIWQPYYTQVGAGTYNPATFLRVLGPEPWNVAYVEPTIRPDDARYGENPNRMQMHYQFQVILKPDPGDPQEVYLRSLEAIGVDPTRHDIRFVEDNWESPALGAWGLGWEVWLDGQEITQFTYFQQAGGQLCNPVSVELTYGLDRIAIALQRVHGFTEIRWNDTLTAGDVNLQAEQEHSKYYFETADVGRLRQMYDLYEAEARQCVSEGLVLPAHDYVLRCSHAFNVLDSRGVIGVTERQAFFGRMRDLARQVAEAYVDQRTRLEFPWLDGTTTAATSAAPAIPQRHAGTVSGAFSGAVSEAVSGAAPFLLEIGTEELPAGDLDEALRQLETRLPALLDELRLSHGQIRIQGTPRRLVAYVDNLVASQPDREQVFKGPPAARAFDALGEPTQAAIGFARSKGVDPKKLEVRQIDGGSYVVAVVQELGRFAPDVLATALPALIASLRFDKAMRWNASNVAFSRPIRWLVALYAGQPLSFAYAGVTAGNLTRGLRFHQPPELQIDVPARYITYLAEQGILLDPAERKQAIQSQVASLAAQVGGTIADDPSLLEEVTNLVEAPLAILGSFDATYLELPREVLISVMKKHQRYFPVHKDGALLPYFIAVTNRDLSQPEQDLELVVEGNQHVIRARFSDAAFFVNEDLKHPLHEHLPRLSTLIFQVKLGSMLDKSHRIKALTLQLAPSLGLFPQETAVAERAAELCKADLVTKMVIEMTSLQGSLGRFYALRSGESQAVADAIYEHYLPRTTGDQLPASRPGLVIGLADRLDTLSGLFAAGLAPTGAKDPFAQRRAALGLVQALIGRDQDFDLRTALDLAASQLPLAASPESQSACLSFIIERLRNLLLELGYRYDVVDAVIAAQGTNPAGASRACADLAAWVARPDWRSILPAYARCVRITRDQAEGYSLDPQALLEAAERDLFAALEIAEAAPRRPGSVEDFLTALLPMIPAINRFFDEVLVMSEDLAQRRNRLALLQRLAALAAGVADMSRLEGF